jgi:hypothetical protein
MTWGNSFISVFSRDQDLFREATGPFGFSEFGGYIGWPFAVLAVVGILGAGLEMIPWFLGMIFFFLCFRGDNLPYAPTHLFRYVPLATNMTICGRWVIGVVFCASVLAAMGANVLAERFGRWGTRAAGFLILAGLIDAWLVCAGNYRYLFRTDITPPPLSQSFRQNFMEHPTLMYPLAAANTGTVRCKDYGYTQYNEAHPRGAALGYNEPGYRGEYYLLGAGTVGQLYWSPNRLIYDVNVPAATSLVINQNTYPGWYVAHGDGEVYDEDGLIAVHIPPGHQSIDLKYRPTHIWPAYLATLFATVLAIVLCVTERRRAKI